MMLILLVRAILVLFLLITIIDLVTDTIGGSKYKTSPLSTRSLYSSLVILNKTGKEKVNKYSSHLFFMEF